MEMADAGEASTRLGFAGMAASILLRRVFEIQSQTFPDSSLPKTIV